MAQLTAHSLMFKCPDLHEHNNLFIKESARAFIIEIRDLFWFNKKKKIKQNIIKIKQLIPKFAGNVSITSQFKKSCWLK